MTTDNAEGGQLLRAAEDLVRNKAAPRGRGSVRYRLAPYRDDLRELLISSPLSIRALARLLESLEKPVVVTPNSLNRYLKTEWPDEWEKHSNRLNGGRKNKSSPDKKPASTTEKKTEPAKPAEKPVNKLLERANALSEKI